MSAKTFDEWLASLRPEDRYNFDREGRGYKKDCSTMMRLAFNAGWQASLTQPAPLEGIPEWQQPLPTPDWQKPIQPAPQGVAEVLELVWRYRASCCAPPLNEAYDDNERVLRWGKIKDAITALVQERDALQSDNRLLLSGLPGLASRVAELGGDVARDAARWRHCKKHGVPVFGLSEVTGTPSLWRAQAFGRSYIADSLQEAVDMAIAAAKEPSHG